MNSQVDIIIEKMKTTDGESIHLKRWSPKDCSPNPVVVQIVHGMAEHIERYHDFANALVKEGCIVYGNDHRGHGKTAKDPKELGYFADRDGWERVINDLHEITEKIKQEYPQGKIILFGHSMGSFLARRYVQLFPKAVDALILSGTGYSKGLLGKIGIKAAVLSKLIHNKRKPNKFLDTLAFGGFNKRFQPNQTNFDWLSRDAKAVETYVEDPLCGFIFTTGGFYDLFNGIEALHQKENIEKTPKNLPIYILSGENDPVGDYGEEVKKVYQAYEKLGIKDIQYKLYTGGRHEMLNEINKQEVYNDIIHWIKTTVNTVKQMENTKDQQ
ncbi:Lysophospholipase, alpha-beta hydrolase superfamily [Natronincola peptidivorans]|uniref:Lysophospholipase, alpha-beta hydrolase superfamily n=1 Tax=Natronincola peptidivorans TaxID=426128 RepID=A0A1I0FME2_9FIRM|nr:alpha/beta hydrolase [Natronincola peptidivorans]SET59290.1 Lysophospholipase, alpha-beta hydrolase superfamily [Natronincola peptidivorans]